MPGMHGTYEANMTMQNCDVLLAVGARFDDRVIGNPAHFATVRAQDHPTSTSTVVDLQARQGRHPHRRRREGRAAGADRPDQESAAGAPRRGGAGRTGGARSGVAQARLPQVRQHRGHQAAVRGRQALGDDSGRVLITSDVGQHQMWAAQYYRFDEPRRWINSGLGTMGVGLPYAMGIKLANPGCDVFVHHRRGLDPDVHPGALDLPRYNTPVKINAEQPLPGHGAAVAGNLDYQGRYSTATWTRCPTSSKLAEAYGHVGMKIERNRVMSSALRRRSAEGSYRVPGLRTDPTEVPMVKGGQGHHRRYCWAPKRDLRARNAGEERAWRAPAPAGPIERPDRSFFFHWSVARPPTGLPPSD